MKCILLSSHHVWLEYTMRTTGAPGEVCPVVLSPYVPIVIVVDRETTW
jgi:hypothetical protein